MNARELRIGNWVRTVYPINKKPFQVYPIAFKQMPTDKKHDLILDTWEGIPLTEEWLLRFGFENYTNDVNGGWFSPEGMYEVYLSGVFNSTDAAYTLSSQILFVHQLQNLYFALTGEELELKTDQK